MSDVDFLMERLAIEDLFARYAHTADGYDADGWVDCFTEDGIFELESDGSGLRFIGRQALDDFIRAHIRLLPGTRHVMTNHLVDFDGVRAQHRCTLTGMLSRPDKVYTFISGWYDSALEKVSGQWKIKHRIAHADNAANFAAGELVVHFQPMMDWIAANGTPA
jgi:hypothetical protein